MFGEIRVGNIYRDSNIAVKGDYSYEILVTKIRHNSFDFKIIGFGHGFPRHVGEIHRNVQFDAYYNRYNDLVFSSFNEFHKLGKFYE